MEIKTAVELLTYAELSMGGECMIYVYILKIAGK